MKLLMLILLFAAASTQADTQRPLSRTVEKWQDRQASELIGATAVDLRNERLGTVRDLIIASQTGAVHYAVVSIGGYLGLGDRQYLYPVQALAPWRAADEVVVEVARKDLGERTGVDELERWLRLYDPGSNVADRRYLRATELIGKPIADRAGERVGEIEDLVVNLGSGRLRFVMAEMRQGPQRSENAVALPLEAFDVPVLAGRQVVLK